MSNPNNLKSLFGESDDDLGSPKIDGDKSELNNRSRDSSSNSHRQDRRKDVDHSREDRDRCREDRDRYKEIKRRDKSPDDRRRRDRSRDRHRDDRHGRDRSSDRRSHDRSRSDQKRRHSLERDRDEDRKRRPQHKERDDRFRESDSENRTQENGKNDLSTSGNLGDSYVSKADETLPENSRLDDSTYHEESDHKTYKNTRRSDIAAEMEEGEILEGATAPKVTEMEIDGNVTHFSNEILDKTQSNNTSIAVETENEEPQITSANAISETVVDKNSNQAIGNIPTPVQEDSPKLVIQAEQEQKVSQPNGASSSSSTAVKKGKPKLRKTEIGLLVVKLLTPAYVDKRFESRDIFKTMARKISHYLANKDEDEIKHYVKRFLSRNLEITSKTTI